MDTGKSGDDAPPLTYYYLPLNFLVSLDRGWYFFKTFTYCYALRLNSLSTTATTHK